MPPKRKATLPKEKPVEEVPVEAKKQRGAKKPVEDAPELEKTNGDAKPKRGRQAKSTVEAKPKSGRGKKAPAKERIDLEELSDQEEPAVDIEDESSDVEEVREESPPAEPVEKKGRGRRAVKAPIIEVDDEREGTPDEEPKPKRGRGRKAAAPKVDVEDEDEEEEVVVVMENKPKGRGGRAKKETPSTSNDDELPNPTETGYDKIDFSCTKENKLGKKPNLIIASWNVDGIRAWHKKDGLKYIMFEKPDIFCIQESKCSDSKLPAEVKEFDGYNKYWQNSEKEGYAGVGLFSRTEPINVEYGIGVPEHDEDGRCITAEFDKFYVVSVYVPNAGKNLVTLPKRLEWNKAFKTYIKELDKKKPVIVCGDMNVAHNEIDLTNPKPNVKNAGFTKEEREGMTAFLGDGYVDTYRKLNPEQTGAYTFWTYLKKCRSRNIGWRLDYFIVSERFMDNVCDSVIRSEILGSDHCPVALFINV